jgi:hypothetical protein
MCAFCAQPAEASCGWKTIVPVDVRADEVLHGDVLSTRPGELCGRVTAIETGDGRNLRLFYRRERPQREGWITRRPWERVYVDHPRPCEEPCCVAHCREMDEGLHYCAEHWKAWESIS